MLEDPFILNGSKGLRKIEELLNKNALFFIPLRSFFHTALLKCVQHILKIVFP
jgi:hypothetical protein